MYKNLILFSIILFVRTQVFSSPLQQIDLYPGNNEVIVNIRNKSTENLKQLHLVSQEKHNPEGIYIKESKKKVNISAFTNKMKSMEIKILVTEEASQGNDKLLLKLKDGQNQVWKYNLQINIKSPKKFELKSNYPNPFNPSTQIEYKLNNKKKVNVKLSIFNILGEKVCVLVDKKQTAGLYKKVWNGRDNKGNKVPNGVYFYRLKAGSQVKEKKMTLLK